jgi:hypothetical protein
MPSQAPKIDPRTSQEIVARTEQLAESYAGWQPRADGQLDAGQALIRIFARMAELLTERLNRVPDKNFLAFLDLIGTQILPPQPARVPLTFHLAAGSTNDALVPEHTQVAATPAPGDPGPIIFETERELVVTRSELAAVFVREPGRDRYAANYLTFATGAADDSFAPFTGETATAHRLYLAHSQQFGLAASRKDITLRFTPAEGSAAWLALVQWERWDGQVYTPIPKESVAISAPAGGGWQMMLSAIPAIPAATPGTPASADPAIGKLNSCWLRGTLLPVLPRNQQAEQIAAGLPRVPWRANLGPDAAFADNEVLNLGQICYPFGKTSLHTEFYVASTEAFASRAPVTIAITFDPDQPAQPSADLTLIWEFWNGTTWQELGQSTPLAAVPAPTAQGFIDQTRALTRDGSLSFVSPANWQLRSINQTGDRLWLRARIASGSYRAPAGYRPPAIQSMSLSYGALPRISTIQSRVHAVETDLAPDVAFVNQLQVDLSKDFFPFGEKPKFGDTLYLASDRAFAKPGAKVTLTITLTNPKDETATPLPARPQNVKLAWEYWDGKLGAWQVLTIDNTTMVFAFTDEKATVTFTCPDTLAASDINGQQRYWIRVRIAGGNYGSEASYTPVIDPRTNEPKTDPTTGLPIYQLKPADFRPPSIKSIKIGYDYTSEFQSLDYALIENDFVVEDVSLAAKTSDNVATPVDEDRAFEPFKPMLSGVGPALYLGFRRPGATTGFANRPTVLYVSVADVLYDETSAALQALAEQAGVIWEYWNGQRWARLGTRDETESFTRRGLITFIGPQDFLAKTDFGMAEPLFWLRVVWERGAYAYVPRLQRVLTNTIWAAHTLTIMNEVLGSSTGEPDQRFHTTRTPLLPGQAIEVREAELPSATERAAIEAEEDADAITPVIDASGRTTASWVRWHEVPDFYGSGPRSRHYTLDRLSGEVRFGDSRLGLIPPLGRGNVRIARYQTGGGPAGNRPPGTITQLKTTVPLVDNVTNPEPATGGADQEALAAVMNRGPRSLRHRGLAVAIADFEDLTFLASPDVALVRGIAAKDSTNAGAVELVVVPRGGGAKPVPSLELLGRVHDYIEPRMAPTVDLLVRGPDWLQVTVSAEVVPIALEAATDVQNAILSRLAAFLHPLTGGLDSNGWAFGRKPYRSDLYALIERIPGVSYVRRLQVDEQPDTDGLQPDHALVYSGDHAITMSSEADLSNA